jgi:hypothetical protein
MIAIAMHEQNRRYFRNARRSLRQGLRTEGLRIEDVRIEGRKAEWTGQQR